MRRASIVRFAMISLVLGAGVFLYVAALQTSETVRFEFGSMDWDFLGNPEAFEAISVTRRTGRMGTDLATTRGYSNRKRPEMRARTLARQREPRRVYPKRSG